MKKYLMLFSIALIISLNSSGQFGNRRMRGTEVAEIGFSINVDTASLNAKSVDLGNIIIQIKPTNPSLLDNLFYNSLNLNGAYSYSYFDSSREKYFFKRKRRRGGKFKTDEELLIEGAKWLLNSDIITDEIFEDIYQDIQPENDSNDLGINSSNRKGYNPYFIGDKYLSTYEIVLTNKTNKIQFLDEVLQLKTNDIVLQPLSNSQILSFQKTGAKIADIEVLERFNYSNNIAIPPNSEVKKYMAFLPVDINNNTVELFITTEDKTHMLRWNFDTNKKFINEKYFYYALQISHDFGVPGYEFYHLSESVDAYVDEDILYINKEDINKPIKIFCYCKSYSFSNLYYGTVEIKAADYLDFEKNRRSEIELESEKIDDISQKR